MQLNTSDVEEEVSRNSEWSATMNDMLQEVKDYMTPFGTVGQLIDETPKEVISKVFFEDMLYQTWHHGRTILIGDGKKNFLEKDAGRQSSIDFALTNTIFLLFSFTLTYSCP